MQEVGNLGRFKKGRIPWNKGRRCSEYNWGRPRKNPKQFCLDCKKEIDYGLKRCLSCYNKSREKITLCVDCEQVLKDSRQLRCRKCDNTRRWNDKQYKKNVSKSISLSLGGTGISRRKSCYKEYGGKFDDRLKEQIRFRDKYICQVCGCSQLENGKQLDVHHVDYTKQNCDVNNLVALCHSCHAKTKTNRNEWISYFTQKREVNIHNEVH